MTEADDTTESVPPSGAPGRDEVLQFVERVRKDHGEATAPWSARILVEADKAQALADGLATLPMGTEAALTQQHDVDVKFDPRQVFAVAVMAVSHGGMYVGRGN